VEWWTHGVEPAKQSQLQAPLEVTKGDDGVWRCAGEIPAQADQAVVHYAFVFEAGGLRRRLTHDPLSGEPFRFYVWDGAVQTKLPLYALEVAEDRLAQLQSHPERERYPATFTSVEPGEAPRIGGLVELQAQGDDDEEGRRWSKRSWLIRFQEGAKRIHLRTTWRDPTALRTVLGFDLYDRAGAVAPRARLVRVHINGAFFGLYTAVEAVDEQFLRRRGFVEPLLFQPQSDGRRYSVPSLYHANWAQRTQTDRPSAALATFIEGYHETDDVQGYLERTLDVERYVNYLAATALIHHWDSVTRNFFWCLDGLTKKWTVIPWDLDRTWGDHFEGRWIVHDAPLAAGTEQHPIQWGERVWWNRLRDRFLSVPAFRTRLEVRIGHLTHTAFDAKTVGARIERLGDDARAETLLDSQRWSERWSRVDESLVAKPLTTGNLRRELARLASFTERRGAFLVSGDEAQHRDRFGLLSLSLLAVGLLIYAWRTRR
jgi:hypothetical protein